MTTTRPLADVDERTLLDELAVRREARAREHADRDLADAVRSFLALPTCARALVADRAWDGEWLINQDKLRTADLRALADAVARYDTLRPAPDHTNT